VKLPDLGEIRPEVSFVSKKHEQPLNVPSYRPVVGVSLGCDLSRLVSPHVDSTDPLTTLGGLGKRLAFVPPVPKLMKLRRIRRFVQKWCKDNLDPLEPTSDCSFETWLANTSYTETRKNELRKVYDLLLQDPYYKLKDHCPNDRGVDCFIKDETYDEYKYSRGIYSRTDTFKVCVGPIIKLIEKQLYAVKSRAHQLPYFIKNVPVSERPAMLMQMYSVDAIYLATDYTSFEGHFIPKVMEAIECTLYDYMIQYLPEREWFKSSFISTILGVNNCNFYYFTLKIQGTRMSGEMNTSLGNGFSNLMIMLFICEERKIPEPPGFVEGDDGIFRFKNRFNVPTVQDYADLGFTIKIEQHINLATASFCGIIFDEEDQCNLTNPISALLEFGWTTRRYSRSKSKVLFELLRAKSYSMLYSYPGCPILRALAEYGIRITQGYYARFNFQNEYSRERYQHIVPWLQDNFGVEPRVGAIFSKSVFPWEANARLRGIVVGSGSRNLIYLKYGIPVDTQILFENYLNNLTELQVLDSDLLLSFINKDVLDYSSRYVLNIDYNRKDIDYQSFYNFNPIPFNRYVMDKINEKKTVLYKKW